MSVFSYRNIYRALLCIALYYVSSTVKHMTSTYFPFINNDVVPAAYTPDSICRSSRPNFRYFLPIIAKNSDAI